LEDGLAAGLPGIGRGSGDNGTVVCAGVEDILTLGGAEWRHEGSGDG
jgi:hypothetical protein